jgi:hypothetical protein
MCVRSKYWFTWKHVGCAAVESEKQIKTAVVAAPFQASTDEVPDSNLGPDAD